LSGATKKKKIPRHKENFLGNLGQNKRGWPRRKQDLGQGSCPKTKDMMCCPENEREKGGKGMEKGQTVEGEYREKGGGEEGGLG